MRILIGSIGRRNYLADWLRGALNQENVSGEIIVMEADARSAGATAGDQFLQAPRYEDPEYPRFLADALEAIEPSLFFSVNDYEISLISWLFSTNVVRPPAVHFVPHWDAQRVLEDKYSMALALERFGLPGPPTRLGVEYEAIVADAQPADRFVVKHRYGSGSSGVQLVESSRLLEAVDAAASNAPSPPELACGKPPPHERVIVQPYLDGEEVGVDGVYSAISSGRLDAVLARRKLRMRSGETDQAITVDGGPFAEHARMLGERFDFRGSVDMDFIISADGTPMLIDINPRFGGGYPFSHIAGADVLRYYVREILTSTADCDLLRYDSGVSGAKFEAIVRTGIK